MMNGSPTEMGKDRYRNKSSILVPTYNERENVLTLTRLLMDALSERDFEVVFIDDNSPDGTAEVIKELSHEYENVKVLVRPMRMGLGSAYKDGFNAATGDLIVEMDADLSHNPEELPKLLKALNGADVVVGSRYAEGGKHANWKWRRVTLSRGANSLSRIILGLEMSDVTSGFRAYKRRAFEEIASRSKFNGFDFQVEALHIAKKLGFRIKEVPITFTDRERGKSKLRTRDIATFVISILRMHFNKKI